jgi:alpha-glucosidase
MFGDALLVAPVVTEGVSSQQIYLPPGDWFDYAKGQRYKGAQDIQIATDAKTWNDIPLFVRAGSILATQPVEQYVGQNPVTEITLDIFPSGSSGKFTVYDDDGDTYNYEKGEYLRQEISAQQEGSETTVKIDSATGSYSAPLRTYLLKIHTAAAQVTLNGRNLPLTTGASDPGRPGADFVRQNDRFGPVELLRVVAGEKSPSTISLR